MKVTVPKTNSLNEQKMVHTKRLSHRERVHVCVLTISTKLTGKRVTGKVPRRAIKAANKGDESSTLVGKLSAALSIRNNCQAFASNSSMFVPWRIKPFVAKILINESMITDLSKHLKAVETNATGGNMRETITDSDDHMWYLSKENSTLCSKYKGIDDTSGRGRKFSWRSEVTETFEEYA